MRHLGWIPVLLAMAVSTAAASGCKLAMFPPLPVKVENLTPIIAVKINGATARFIVDTGSFAGFLSPATAAQFKLPLTYAPAGYYVRGVGGLIAPRVATARTFSVGGVTAHDVPLLVGDNDFGGGIDGLLGPNVFRAMDAEYDFANGVLRFVIPQHCEGKVLAYWAAGKPIGVVDLHRTSDTQPHLIGNAQVNGRDIRVLFDTGSPRTILSLAAARYAGITPETPGAVSAGTTRGLGGRVIQVWNVPVGVFEIGGEKIERTRFLIGDIDLGEIGADMLLGADFFLAHHIYVAHSQNRLYFTYNGGPVFDVNARPPVQAASAPGNPVASGPASASQPGAVQSGNSAQPSSSDVPTDAAGFVRRGMAETSRGQLSLAIADLTRACELAAADADCRYQRGLAYWRNRNPQRALTDFNDALRLAPGDYDARLARAELQLPQLHAGIAGDLDAVNRLAPPEADSRLQLATLYGSIGRYGAAAHQLDLWIHYHGQDSRLYGALAVRCWARAAADVKLDQALADCNRAVRANAASHSIFWRLSHRDPPGPSWLLRNRSLVYLRLGDLDKAIADDDAALAEADPGQDGKKAYPLYLRGLAELRKGLKSQGQADLAAARKLQPHIEEYYANMGLTP